MREYEREPMEALKYMLGLMNQDIPLEALRSEARGRAEMISSLQQQQQGGDGDGDGVSSVVAAVTHLGHVRNQVTSSLEEVQKMLEATCYVLEADEEMRARLRHMPKRIKTALRTDAVLLESACDAAIAAIEVVTDMVTAKLSYIQ